MSHRGGVTGMARVTVHAWIALLAIAGAAACGRGSRAADVEAPEASVLVSAPSATAPGAAKPGMAWIPSGTLHAGSAIDDVPRVADAEQTATDVAMGGFYIDVLPWPNEPGAIPTTHVSRDEAARLCQEKGKRLCTELEWERACKGPTNARYEYGPSYDPRVCGAGVSADSPLKPSGQRLECRSGFGVRDMHGGPAEWTDSTWRRGPQTRDVGVVRGGNDTLGELVTRCAAARPFVPADRSASVGFRCCAGLRNDAEVQLDVKRGVAFESAPAATRASPPLQALGGIACGPPRAPKPCSIGRAWIWRPSPNVELDVSGGCVGLDPHARCSVAISRPGANPAAGGSAAAASGSPSSMAGGSVAASGPPGGAGGDAGSGAGGARPPLAEIDTGVVIPEVVLVESADHHIRVRGANAHGYYFREVIFNYGRVEVRSAR